MKFKHLLALLSLSIFATASAYAGGGCCPKDKEDPDKDTSAEEASITAISAQPMDCGSCGSDHGHDKDKKKDKECGDDCKKDCCAKDKDGSGEDADKAE